MCVINSPASSRDKSKSKIGPNGKSPVVAIVEPYQTAMTASGQPAIVLSYLRCRGCVIKAKPIRAPGISLIGIDNIGNAGKISCDQVGTVIRSPDDGWFVAPNW